MICRNHTIRVGSYNQKYRLLPIGDVHFGAAGFRQDVWDAFVREVQADNYTITIGTGDISDVFRPSVDKHAIQAMGGDGEAVEQMDQLHKAHMRDCARRLKPVIFPGRCLGLLSGHHAERVYADGTNGTQYLCQLLNVPYLSDMCLVRVVFLLGRKVSLVRRTPDSVAVVIHAHHGGGAAGFISSDMTNLERKITPYWDADIYLRGHSHKKYGAHMSYGHMTYTTPPGFRFKDKIIANVGGYLDGYLAGESTYVSRKALPPCPLGWTEIGMSVCTERWGDSPGQVNHVVRLSVTT